MKLVEIFKKAKFSPSICDDMDSWQKTHIAVVIPISKALYRYNSDNYKLSKSYITVKMMVLATRECFEVLKIQNIKVTPVKLNFYYLPTFMIVPLFMGLMNTKISEYAMAKHTIEAKEEIGILVDHFSGFIKKSGLQTPSLDWLM